MPPRNFVTSSFFAGLLIGILSATAAADMLGSSVFPDVQPGSYYDAAVGRLYGAGIIKGGADGKFHGEEYVRRAEIAVMLDRALNGGATPVGSTIRRRGSSSVSSSSSVTSASSSSSSSSAATVGEAGAFRFSAEKVSFPESASNVSFSIQRISGKTGAVTVKYTTVDGSAKAGVRYNQSAGVVRFADGETTKVVSLKFINNLIAEPNETFTVALSEPTGGAVLGAPTAVTVTVLDNDGGGGTPGSSSSSSSSSGASGAPGGKITFSAWSYAVDESAGALSVTVLRKGSSSSAVNVDYATAAGTAQQGLNYNHTQGTLSFAAGETSKTFSVQVVHQSTIDGNKNLTLKLTNPTGGAALDLPNSAPLTVADTEASATATGTVMFSSSSFIGKQKEGSALITVYRRGSYGAAVTVNYATSDSTAISNVDYTPTSGTMTFAPGEANKTFTIPIVAGKFSGEKRVNLALSAVTGPAVLGVETNAVLTIYGQ